MREDKKFQEPTMAQMRKLFAMTDGEQQKMPEELFQLFIEDPWRILEAVWIESVSAYDTPSLRDALASCGLRLDDGLQEAEIPWVPESGVRFAHFRLQRSGGAQTVQEIIDRLEANFLSAATLPDLMRLAHWRKTLHWEVPVIALGSMIKAQDRGVCYPLMLGRSLSFVTVQELEHGSKRPVVLRQRDFLYLGRQMT